MERGGGMKKSLMTMYHMVMSFFGTGSGTICSHVAHAVETGHHVAVMAT
jgi:fibrillarin-like rRNA methylase